MSTIAAVFVCLFFVTGASPGRANFWEYEDELSEPDSSYHHDSESASDSKLPAIDKPDSGVVPPGSATCEYPDEGADRVVDREEIYCNTKCGKRHLACGPIEFSSSCPASTSIVDLTGYQYYILQLHNKLRNLVAGGQIEGLPTAARMGEMIWDDELAALAMIYAMQCQLHFKTCYTTARFPYVGRNSGLYKTSRRQNVRQLLQGRIEYWFQQLDAVRRDNLKHYPSEELSTPISSVTVAINEKSNRIGCGAVQFEDNDMHNFLLVCFYSYTNIHNERVYLFGRPTSQCRKGRSRKYSYLCDAQETYLMHSGY